MPVAFRPGCLPSALGVLPHTTPEAAWDVVVRHLPALPALPLLAAEGEDPATIAADGFGGAMIMPEELHFDRSAVTTALDDLYLAYLQNDVASRALSLVGLESWGQYQPVLKRAEALSMVVMGPISLALRLVDDSGRTALTDVVVVDALAKHLYLRLRWQQSVVGRVAQAGLYWLYEPYLNIVGSPFCPIDWPGARQLLEETFGALDGARAVWAGESTDIAALIDGASVEVIGLPLPLPNLVAGWAAALGKFIRRHGAIAWGIVPNTVEGLAHARVGQLAARFNAVLQALDAAGLPAADVVNASMIMPEDTLGHLYPSEAEAALALTGQLAGLLRHSYGLD